jgi:hypothetical protein
VGDDDSDDSDSEENDSEENVADDRSTQRPPMNGVAGTSTGVGAHTSGDNKRERPEDMQDEFVAVKRANIPLASLLTKAEPSAPSSGRVTPTSTEGPTLSATEGEQHLPRTTHPIACSDWYIQWRAEVCSYLIMLSCSAYLRLVHMMQ